MLEASLISNPIFLVGAERSGTTVLRLMLNHHPDIVWCNEFEYIVDQISQQGDFPSLKQYTEWLETHRIFQSTGFKINPSLSYPQLANSFLAQKRDLLNKPIVGATVHRHFDRLLQIWSKPRFIHLVRDGRDVARSCIGMGWVGNVWTGIRDWQKTEYLWDSLCEIVPPEQRCEMKYEELILDPVSSLGEICRFIGVSYDPAMLNYAEDTTYDLPDPKFLQQWRRKLSDFEIRLVESRVAGLLEKRGYELSGLPLLEVSSVMAQRLYWQDWWARARFRLNRYGMVLFFTDYFSRHLGLKQQQKGIKLKINKVNTGYLK